MSADVLPGMDVSARAASSKGISSDPIYRMAVASLGRIGASGTVVDVGCGTGGLYRATAGRFRRYIGADVYRHPGYPPHAEFAAIDPDAGRVPLPDGCADVAVALETIEHVENPRAFVRELTRLVRPGGWVLVSTPNNRSLASLAYLVTHGCLLHFQERDGSYPAHITALFEIDLVRIATECRLVEPVVTYTGVGRVPKTRRHWPGWLSATTGRRGGWFSDNVLQTARRPAG